MRNLYVIQPYVVGSKNSRSLALVIPASIVKEYQIDTSTVFALKPKVDTRTITLYQTTYPIGNLHQKEMNKPTGERVQSYQPAGRRAH